MSARRPRLVWRVFASYAVVVATSVVVVGGGLVVLDDHLREPHALSILAGALVVAAVVALAISYLLARRFSHPVEELRRAAERLGRGELKRRIPAPPALEFAELADALNTMAAQLDERIAEITRQRNERVAILESMREGVLAIDRDERILLINRTAEEMLGVAAGREIKGRLVQEVFRNPEVQRYLQRAQAGPRQVFDDGTLLRLGAKTLIDARCAPLRDDRDNDIGLVVILTNVTRLHQLENLRKEFVANVSHELRTPITSIKGFAETLLDGALDDPNEAQRFVEIIWRQSERLGHVIEDLLSLSTLDRTEAPEREECELAEVLRSVIELRQPVAAERQTIVELDCPAHLRVFANAGLIERAIGNLVENAIKYSGVSARVMVRAESRDGGVRVRVIDNGPGIATEHLPRLFERFYRVDKARSRELGGTGLGLSIVKNIASLHGGSVGVETEIGRGSTFWIQLPSAPPPAGLKAPTPHDKAAG